MWYTLFLQGNGVYDVTREMWAGSSLFNVEMVWPWMDSS